MKADGLKTYIEENFDTQNIIAINEDYKGLKGTILAILVGMERITENDSRLDIVVELNGASSSSVVLSEDDLGFFKGDRFNKGYFLTVSNQLICLGCCEPISYVTETQYDDLAWKWDNDEQTYYKIDCGGEASEKHCGKCEAILDVNDLTEQYLPYF